MRIRLFWILPAFAGVLPLVSCKKEPGAGSREAVEEAGYELDAEAFFRAAESDDLKALESMIDAGIGVDARDAAGRTALHAAAGSGALKSIDFLLDRGLPVDAKDAKGRTPLMEALLRSTPETVRYLLRQGADPQQKDNENYKSLMLAVRDGRTVMVSELAPYVREDLDDALLAASILGQPKIIDELTNYGASIYARWEDGRTPLMLAAQNGQGDAVDMLLEIGANRFAMSESGMLAADYARQAGHADLADRLAGEPREGDFELEEPAELGAEMVMALGTEENDGVPMVDPGDEAVAVADGSTDAGSPDEGVDPAIASNDPEPQPGNEPADGSATPWNAPEPGEGGGALGQLPRHPRRGEVASLDGAVVGSGERPGRDDSASEGTHVGAGPRESDVPVIMRSYRQRELPLRVESTTPESATIRVPGGATFEVPKGEPIPGSQLKIVKIRRKMQSGKNDGGVPTEVSIVSVEDAGTGISRDLVVGLPALAHDPVALVEDSASGQYYVARTGQRFRSSDGREFIVGDVRPNQLVIEEVGSGEVSTLPLHGPRG
ncbi:ankyrin repeat domain-containing protein [Haloferula helveola]|uniref:ankyrin repeat domain-containing protein n=1 Tax=Haloferula helveola TaxID=490095 RepID=UPI0030A1E0AC